MGMSRRSMGLFIAGFVLLAGCDFLGFTGDDSPPAAWFPVLSDSLYGDRAEGRLHVTAVHFLSKTVGFAGGQWQRSGPDEGFVAYTEDGGSSWDFRPVDDPTTAYFDATNVHDLAFADRETGIVTNRTIEYTTDGGRTWMHLHVGSETLTNSVLEVRLRPNSQVGWAGGPNGAIARTEDGGRTWTFFDTGHPDERFGSISFAGKAVWLSAGTLLVSSRDEGRTWTEHPLPLVKEAEAAKQAGAVRLGVVAFANAECGWAAGDLRRIVRTCDGGKTWRRQTVPSGAVHDAITDLDALNRQRALAVTSHGSVLRTDDGGETWRELSPAQDEQGSYRAVQMLSAEVAYAVTGGGRLMKTVTGGCPARNVDLSTCTGPHRR